MGTFSNGFWIRFGCGLLVAPMTGQEMRQMLLERGQQLRHALPEREHLTQAAQQASAHASQRLKAGKETTQQVVSQGKTVGSGKSTSSSQESPTPERTHLKSIKGHPSTYVAPASNPLASLPLVSEQDASHEHPLDQHTGIHAALQARFQSEGIVTIEQLVNRTATKEERSLLAPRVGLTEHQLKTLVTHTDLARMQGIGEEEAALLEAAGVSGSHDLQGRNPEHLHTKVLAVHQNQPLMAQTPDLEQVATWIAEAMEVTAHE